MADQYKEVLSFLHDKNPAVRSLAASALLEQTPAGSPHRNIFLSQLSSGGLKPAKDPEVFRDFKLLCRDQPDVAHSAFKALVNLSDTSAVISALNDPPFISFLVSYIINPPSLLAELAAMLLSNLSANSSVCTTLLELKIPITASPSIPGFYYPPESRSPTSPAPIMPPDAKTTDVLALPLLVEAFVQGASKTGTSASSRKANLHFLASVFANITITPKGRLFFLTPYLSRPLEAPSPDNEPEFLISKLIIFTEHPDLMRRGGVASTIKNCCFHQGAHKALLEPAEVQVEIAPSTIKAPGVNVLLAILTSLAGPEEFDFEDNEKLPSQLQFLPDTKKREADPVLRLTHLESLVLLCTTRWGRERLRDSGAYLIVRELHKAETDDKVMETVERLVNLLQRKEAAIEEVDEPTNVPNEDEDEDDVIVEI